ncbi:HNH endonuclease [Stenotrophomonas acidaminiphila]|jgi:5-methylcytosine-specific restriction endonuclease McrA
MIYWDRLETTVCTQQIVDELEASRVLATAWEDKAHANAKVLLKRALFPAQASRCAYCRRRIRDEIGHVEIDHILPKKATKYLLHADSNDDRRRRSTRGYPGFCFTALNLVLTCKRCNNRKGSYDCRTDRSLPAPTVYPNSTADYIWVHPYFHSYSHHIEVHAGYVYLPVAGSLAGKAVITACRLDKIGAIELRSAEESMNTSMGLEDIVTELWTRYMLTNQQMVDIVVKNFVQLDPQHVLRIISSTRRDIQGLASVIADIKAML